MSADAQNDFSRDMALQEVLNQLEQAEPETLSAIAHADRKLGGALALLLLVNGRGQSEVLPKG